MNNQIKASLISFFKFKNELKLSSNLNLFEIQTLFGFKFKL